MSESLVLELWGSIPALAQQSLKPTSVLVAVAALAHDIRRFDAMGKHDFSERLLPSLRTLMALEVHKLDVAQFTSVDARGELTRDARLILTHP